MPIAYVEFYTISKVCEDIHCDMKRIAINLKDYLPGYAGWINDPMLPRFSTSTNTHIYFLVKRSCRNDLVICYALDKRSISWSTALFKKVEIFTSVEAFGYTMYMRKIFWHFGEIIVELAIMSTLITLQYSNKSALLTNATSELSDHLEICLFCIIYVELYMS